MPPPSAVTASAAASSFLRSLPPPSLSVHTALPPSLTLKRSAGCHSRVVARASASGAAAAEAETVFFDGGAHYGDLAANLVLGLTLLWLPLTLASVTRALFLRYRFTSRRVTVISGLSGDDRTDFPYSSVREVVVVPRFIGEWGDIVITLKDGTKVDLRSVPRFREVADYCRKMAAAEGALGAQ
ncbi:uncharacterized protein LOC124695957 [Lolium rigidum]|uniref:uncharacterized protein LOC124695957 n=1 Tax=Lolium rigidum TaxID=89674 RepID=UPI001F5D0860|nr:uncharacterized protein LOC124695957 [Lolium rigidum]